MIPADVLLLAWQRAAEPLRLRDPRAVPDAVRVRAEVLRLGLVVPLAAVAESARAVGLRLS